jgi:hypothetical protein
MDDREAISPAGACIFKQANTLKVRESPIDMIKNSRMLKKNSSFVALMVFCKYPLLGERWSSL